MALINCPECNNMISDKAKACPKCGLPSEYFVNINTCESIDAENPETEKYISYTSQTDDDNEIDINNLDNILITFDKDYNQLLSHNSYIETHKLSRFINFYKPYYENTSNPLIMKYIENNLPQVRSDLNQIKDFIYKFSKVDTEVESHNNRYIEMSMQENKVYFDGILKDIDAAITLDDEQRRAVIIDDNYCLLVAGAGAGKTTTMAAKVKYLVDKRKINPEEIIVISYTNKAIDELKDRINNKLRIPAKISTFHSFAFEIVKKFSVEPPEINFSSYQIVYEMLEKEIYHDKALMRNLVLFLGYYFDLTEDVFKFANLEQYHMYRASMDYQTLRSNLGEYIKRVQNQRYNSVKTITGEYLRSVQEVQIANFLYLNNIDYEYEKVYIQPIYGSKKKYTPDFYIKQGEHVAYIEHYALSENYNSFVLTPEEIFKYKKSIQDKRKLHSFYKTTLIETWSYYNDKRPLIDHLKEELEKNGFTIKQRDYDEVYKKIVDTGKDKYIIKLVWFMINFIQQFKTTGYKKGGFQILRQKTDNPRTILFLDIAEKVYDHYQNILQTTNQIDFADMINDAHDYLLEIEKQGITLPYKYIVIDEFQDIARQRFNFTKRLSEITNAKVVAVGDDWQSIFAFAGSDISLFTRFLELMGTGKELKITHTYRNSQELIDIAGGFIQKNSAQIKKRLISPKHLPNPIEIMEYDDGYKPIVALASLVEDMIGRIVKESGEQSSILLVGRYNFDLYNLCQTQKFFELPGNKVKSVTYPKAKIYFMTAHSSKGLGFDNVILINMTEGKFGFPSQVENDPIMKLVTYEDSSIAFAEERRLFYVALTRTKNKVYIAAPKKKPSRFLIELIKDYNLPHSDELNMDVVDLFRLRCPVCGYPLKYEYNNNYGLNLYICTNEAEVCDFMANSKMCMKDIKKCPSCHDGYLVIKQNKNDDKYFYGCTNFDSEKKCTHSETIY